MSRLASSADDVRKKIVATKEGGAITGEERLREYVGDLYGDVSQFEGRPTDEQVARAEVLGRQLDDVVAEFNQVTADRLPGINVQLKDKKIAPIEALSEQEWQKTNADSESASPHCRYAGPTGTEIKRWRIRMCLSVSYRLSWFARLSEPPTKSPSLPRECPGEHLQRLVVASWFVLFFLQSSCCLVAGATKDGRNEMKSMKPRVPDTNAECCLVLRETTTPLVGITLQMAAPM